MGNACSLSLGRVVSPGLIEVDVCSSDWVEEGQMKEVEVEGHKIIVIREKGQVRVFSGQCPEYGAPLVKGSLAPGVIRCGWHGSCYDSVTGDIIDYPGVASLVRYEAEEREGVIRIRAVRR